MEIKLHKKDAVWRHRGRPRIEIPPEIQEVIDATYKTGRVGTIDMTDEDYNEEETADFLRMISLGASRDAGCRMRIQRDEERGIILFEKVDIRPRRSPGSRNA